MLVGKLDKASDRSTDVPLEDLVRTQKPLEEWDAYIDGANKLGLKEVLKAYESAYNRVRGR